MKKKVVALVARDHGVSALEALLTAPEYDVVAIATHRRRPSTESPYRCPRIEFAVYRHLAAKQRIPLMPIDSSSDQAQFESFLKGIAFDLIATVSWRRKIPAAWIEQATYGGVNLHRGRLPDYPGAEPIKQALLKNEREIVISAHRLTDVIDGGEVLCVAQHPISASLDALDLNEKILALKAELTPYFGPLMLRALNCLARDQAALTTVPD